MPSIASARRGRGKQRAEAAERNAAEPYPAIWPATLVGDHLKQASGDRAVHIGIEIGLRDDEIDRIRAVVKRRDKTVREEVIGPHIEPWQ